MGAPFFFLLLILYLIISANSKSKKKQQTSGKPQGVPQRRTVPGTSSAPTPMKTAPEVSAAQSQVLPTEPIERAKVSVRVSEHHHEDMYAGSMNASEIQGDPENYDQMPSEHSAELFTESAASPETAPEGLKLDFTSSALVNAIIMQEVLKRPTFRQSR